MSGSLICGVAPSRRFWLCCRSWSLHRAQEGNRRGLDLFSCISGRSKKVRAFLGRESVENRANRSASRPAVRFNAVQRRSQNFEKVKKSNENSDFRYLLGRQDPDHDGGFSPAPPSAKRGNDNAGISAHFLTMVKLFSIIFALS